MYPYIQRELIILSMLYEEALQKIGIDNLYRIYRVLSNPPVEYGVDESILIRRDIITQIQKCEYIPLKRLVDSIDNTEVLKEIIPLLHCIYSFYSREISGPEDLLEKSSKYIVRLKSWTNKSKSLYAEDSYKKAVLLLLPSDRQFSQVRGRWGYWLWRDKTYNGDLTPTFDGWLEDIIKVSDALKSEGVKTFLAVDTEALDRVEEVYKNNLLPVDIPPSLPKTGYVRDQSLTWFREPIIGSMALNIRRGEEDIIIEVYRRIGLEPIFKVGWEVIGDRVEMAYLEGGNFIVVDGDDGQAIFTGVGVRGSNHATFKSLSRILPADVKLYGVPISAYIRYWEYGAVHLDVVMMYLGDLNGVKTVFIDPSRMGLYSFLEYNREEDSFYPRNGLEVFKELGINVDEPPHEKSSKITMVNALNLGGGKILVDRYNREVNSYLREYGVDVIEVDIPHIEAGGGGIRCASKEIWID